MDAQKKRLIFAAIVALAVPLAYWLMESESSPMYRFFLYHDGAMGCFTIINVVPLILAFIVGGNVHQPSEIVFMIAAAAQWFALAYWFSKIVFCEEGESDPHAEQSKDG